MGYGTFKIKSELCQKPEESHALLQVNSFKLKVLKVETLVHGLN